ASIEACEARRKLLEEMIVHYEGYEAGTVSALEKRESFGDGLVGTVADLFVPAEGMEVAVEAALGEMAGFIVCRNRATAEAIIDFLKSEKKGKVGILVPDTGTINPVVKRPELTMPEFVGWLDSFVSAPSELRPLMQAVVARTAVFKQSHDPSDILELLPFGFKAVSTDGIVYSKNVIAGGSDDRFPLFRRKEKVAEQEDLLAKLNQQLQDIQRRRNSATAEIAEARAESAQVTQAVESLVEDLEDLKNRTGESDYQRRSVETEIERLQHERQTLSGRLEKIHSRQYTLGLSSDELATAKEELGRSMKRLAEQLANLESASGEALDEVSKLQVSAVEARSKMEQAESKLTHLAELRQEIKRTVETKESEIVNAGQDIESATEKIAELEHLLKGAFERRTEIAARQNSLRTVQTELQERVAGREKLLKDARHERDTLSEQMHKLEMRMNTLESETKTACDRIYDEYEVDIRAAEPACPDETLTPEQAREHVQTQRETLKKFGAVNLLALEEYEAAAERERFLKEQLADLTRAKADLHTTITKINTTARDLFTETFDTVRENFKKLFVELFNGGDADIFLEDPSDPLESGIEITARPGRKRLFSINQMSGGERALTAIALLFSLYLVRQSPFCILDEIDAPLDDANCRRFLRLIGQFSERTQFMVITHNKITMEAADNLYGVTMEQPGISQLVAVRFADIHEDEQGGIVRIDTTYDGKSGVGAGVSADLPENAVNRLDVSLSSDGEPDNES
ncbi:MAG: hypothetical protein AB1744_03110, partial [Candidatus Zixiibacteriota bacterium]